VTWLRWAQKSWLMILALASFGSSKQRTNAVSERTHHAETATAVRFFFRETKKIGDFYISLTSACCTFPHDHS
jgi:hypothetical protein